MRGSYVVIAAALAVSACNKKEAPAKPAKQENKAEDEVESLVVAQGDEGVEGPVPPEASMVFFSVEGALYPLGCYDKTKKTITSGQACLAMVKPGDDVRVASHDSQYNKQAGERAEPQCMAGSGKKVAIGVDGISAGADFKYATWPPAGIKIVNEVDPRSTKPSAVRLSDGDKAKLVAAAHAAGARDVDGLKAHQVAKVHVGSEDDMVYSVYVPHPKLAEQYAWSGIFLAEGGDLGKLSLLQTSRSKKDVFEVRGWLDLDGDGTNELWMRMVFEDGSGDRLTRVTGGKAEPIGKWSCGAA